MSKIRALKIDLNKLNNVVVFTTKKGTKAVAISIPDNYIFQGEKGLYLDCIIFEKDEPDSYKQTASVKLAAPKDMPKEERDKLPFIGNITEIEKKETATEAEEVNDIDSLPF